MDRRKTIKTLLAGTLGGAVIAGTTVGCKTESEQNVITPAEVVEEGLYGRTPAELLRDEQIKAAVFLTDEELTTIATLCDIILPATETAGSATEAAVPAFIAFIVKDIPRNQLPIRGGLMWLNSESNKRYNKIFTDLSDTEQLTIIDDIAYPDPESKKPEMAPGIAFFDRMRNLTLTGYYTTRMGFDDLGYQGNYPNIWDGVPEEVLKTHGVAYEPEWLAKCIDQEKRNEIAVWDEEGNLLT